MRPGREGENESNTAEIVEWKRYVFKMQNQRESTERKREMRKIENVKFKKNDIVGFNSKQSKL